MLVAINRDRSDAGLGPVAWDSLAEAVGDAHAQEMVMNDYLSHWNLAGEGPDLRFGLAGGVHAVQENVYLYWNRFSDGRGAPVEDWSALVGQAQDEFLSSPGHRANILGVGHTHVGIGMAYDSASGTFGLAQEFTNQYATVQEMQFLEDGRVVLDVVLADGTTDPVVNLLFEPVPQRLTRKMLIEEMPHTYSPQAQFHAFPEVSQEANKLRVVVEWAPADPPGYYHVMLWVDTGVETVQTLDVMLERNE